uniref:Uncharacterized protein n=1 Tax=Lepeophtheirus salmonis TaxID=72036 RepID=A0A0K2U875_LEPSM
MSDLPTFPWDFYFWSEMIRKVNEHLHSSLRSLKLSVKRNMPHFNKKNVIKACSPFISSILMVINAESNHIEFYNG